ncbi:MAG: helix-turn-helix domain-containing protein [Mycobacterium sp.]
MTDSSTSTFEAPTAVCAIERTLSVVGERWSLLILRESFMGITRFADFQSRLGIATNVLTTRLDKLVAAGVLTKDDYQRPGERARPEYHLTDTGRDLAVVLGALQQWGDAYLPLPAGPVNQRCHRQTGKPVAVSFVDEHGTALGIDEVRLDGPIPRSRKRSRP